MISVVAGSPDQMIYVYRKKVIIKTSRNTDRTSLTMGTLVLQTNCGLGP